MSLIMTKNKNKSSEIHIIESIIKSSDCEKLLGNKIVSNLHFDYHVKRLTENCEH